MKKVREVIVARWIVIVVVLIAIVGFLFLKNNAAKAKTEKQTVYTVKKETITDSLSISGEVDATEKATVQFQAGGQVVWVGAKEGDYVRKYQGLVALDQRSVAKNIQKSLNTYTNTRATFDQSSSDNQNTSVLGATDDIRQRAQRLLTQSQNTLNNSVIDVELLNLAKENSYVSSPIEGLVVSATQLYPGVNVAPAVPLMQIVNPKTIYFSVLADQTEVVKLHPNMQGTITFDSYPDQKVYGIINSIAFTPKTGETTTVYEVKMKLDADNTNMQYRLGMTGDAEFVLSEIQNVLAIPTNFIKTEADSDKKYVNKKVGDKEEKVYIQLGQSNDTLTEIKSGLKEGDQVYD